MTARNDRRTEEAWRMTRRQKRELRERRARITLALVLLIGAALMVYGGTALAQHVATQILRYGLAI